MANMRISLNKLARLVPDMSPSRIARLPLDRLPESIPEDWCRQFAGERGEALLALSRKLADPAARQRARADLEAQISGAARWIMSPDAMADWLDTIEHNLDQAESLLQRWREGKGALRESGAWASPASLQAEIELSSGGEVRMSDVEHVCGTLLLSFNGRQSQINKYVRLLKSLRKAAERDFRLPQVDAAIPEAERQLERLTSYMSRFRLVRLTLASEEMVEHKRQIEAMSRRRLELDSNLETVRHELRMADSLSGKLKGGRKPDPEQLRRTIESLESQLDDLVVPISDDQIYNWLNQLVDAVLDDYCQSVARTQVDRARALFVSLLKYRRRYSSSPDLNAADAIQRSLRDDATRDLQQLLGSIFGAHKADPVRSVTEPEEYRRSVEQLKNQIIQELLAPTTQRFAISG